MKYREKTECSKTRKFLKITFVSSEARLDIFLEILEIRMLKFIVELLNCTLEPKKNDGQGRTPLPVLTGSASVFNRCRTNKISVNLDG